MILTCSVPNCASTAASGMCTTSECTVHSSWSPSVPRHIFVLAGVVAVLGRLLRWSRSGVLSDQGRVKGRRGLRGRWRPQDPWGFMKDPQRRRLRLVHMQLPISHRPRRCWRCIVLAALGRRHQRRPRRRQRAAGHRPRAAHRPAARRQRAPHPRQRAEGARDHRGACRQAQHVRVGDEAGGDQLTRSAGLTAR